MIYLLIFLLVISCYIFSKHFYNISINSKRVHKDRKENNIDKPYTKEELSAISWLKSSSSDAYIISEDKDKLKLHAKIIEKRSNDNWAIVVHGYGGNCYKLAEYGKAFYDKGYNILMPDLRAHGDSQGSYIGMGITDSLDIVSWCNYIVRSNKNAKIIMFGISMGAATVMSASGNNKLPKHNVKIVIEDCGFSSAYDQLAYRLNYQTKFPKEPLMSVANLYVMLKHGFSFKENQPINMIKNTDIPMYFIHGINDTYVPYKMQEQLYNVYKGPKEKLSVKNCGHALAKEVLGENYFKKIFEFIDKTDYNLK